VAVRGGPQGPTGWSRRGTRPARAPRRRRRQWTFTAVLLVLALAGAVIANMLARSHGTFAVTAVAVAPANPPAPNQCHVTVDVVGTIVTNGHGGTVTYQWTRSGGGTPPGPEGKGPRGPAAPPSPPKRAVPGPGADPLS